MTVTHGMLEEVEELGAEIKPGIDRIEGIGIEINPGLLVVVGGRRTEAHQLSVEEEVEGVMVTGTLRTTGTETGIGTETCYALPVLCPVAAVVVVLMIVLSSSQGFPLLVAVICTIVEEIWVICPLTVAAGAAMTVLTAAAVL
jgi:hypothetical protein